MVGLRECTKEKVLIDGRYVDCWVERRMSFNDKGKMEYTENVLARCDDEELYRERKMDGSRDVKTIGG